MREILFKAKRIDNGKWVYGYYMDRHGCEIIEKGTWHIFDVDENTICQYTGLTDKNGNKIWENDVVIGREGYCGNPNIPTREIMFKVEYSHCHYRWLDSSDMYECEVIGNIFDNPELSKGGVIWTRQKN